MPSRHAIDAVSAQANVCFLGGLFGFVGLLGIRAYLAFGPAFGRFGALLCGAVVTHGLPRTVNGTVIDDF